MKNAYYFQILTVIIIAMMFTQCQKSRDSIEKETPQTISLRSGSNPLTLEWLQSFQTDLATALNGNTPANTYSIEEIAIGTEALITVASPVNDTYTLHDYSSTQLQLDNQNQTNLMVDLYNQSYNAFLAHYESFDSSTTHPLMIHIYVDSTIGNTSWVTVQSIMGIENTCLQNTTSTNNGDDDDDCNPPFDENGTMMLGAGDKDDPKLRAGWVSNMDCDTDCSPENPCTDPATTGPEETQAHVNANIPIPICESNPNKIFTGYTNIECSDDYVGVQYPYNICDNIFEFPLVESCISNSYWNCLYCDIFYRYEQRLYPFNNIPIEKSLISINLFVDECFCDNDNNRCNDLGRIRIIFCYGTPVFKDPPPNWGIPVEIDLEDLILQN